MEHSRRNKAVLITAKIEIYVFSPAAVVEVDETGLRVEIGQIFVTGHADEFQKTNLGRKQGTSD